MRPTLLAVWSLCLLASTAFGQTIHVPGNHPTIQGAVNAAANGTVIVVAPGTYTENVTVSNKTLMIRSSGGAGATTLQGGNARALTLTNAANVTLQGFTIRPVTVPGISGISSTASTVAVRDCIFTGCQGSTSGGAVLVSGGTATFARCQFIGNSATSFGGAISAINNATLTIHNCAFQQNSSGIAGGAIDLQPGIANVANCLFSGNSSQNGGGFATTAIGSTVVNCTFAANSITTGVGQAIAFGGSATNAITIANCIVWGNTSNNPNTGPIAGTGGTTTFAVTYSNVQGGFAGTGNINANPLFRNASIPGDYRLQAASPCIDAGSNSAVPADVLDLNNNGNTSERLPVDLGDEPRFVDLPSVPDTGEGTGTIVDMGAYEHPAPCVVDFNGDGVINSSDISAYISAWLQAVQTGACP